MAVTLVSCATPYQKSGLTGGFSVMELRPDVFRVSFQGNGYTTRETVQVYWLNRCAELALEKGFTGFEVLSDMKWVMRRRDADVPPASRFSAASLNTRISLSADDINYVDVWKDQGRVEKRPLAPVRLARGMIFVYGGGGAAIPRPGIEGDVHFLTGPVEAAPPQIFNAKTLQAQLEPIIKAEKCGVGNVCPHVHEYLLPKGTLR